MSCEKAARTMVRMKRTVHVFKHMCMCSACVCTYVYASVRTREYVNCGKAGLSLEQACFSCRSGVIASGRTGIHSKAHRPRKQEKSQSVPADVTESLVACEQKKRKPS
eukprot:1804183-Pleurochrysis_carterae.AAC.1